MPFCRIVAVRASQGQLSDEIGKLSLGKGRTPYRMLAHPSGKLFLFADQPAGNLHRVDVELQAADPPHLSLDAGKLVAGYSCAQLPPLCGTLPVPPILAVCLTTVPVCQ